MPFSVRSGLEARVVAALRRCSRKQAELLLQVIEATAPPARILRDAAPASRRPGRRRASALRAVASSLLACSVGLV
jgi:hypothetical protein